MPCADGVVVIAISLFPGFPGSIPAHEPCADGVVVIAISLFPEVLSSIPERAKKMRLL